jgi:alpha-galactosidase
MKSPEAANLENDLKETVAMGCELDDCENWPHPGEAREKIDGLLAKASAIPDPHPSPYDSNLRLTSKFISEDFVPDGNLEKRVWRDANWVKVDRDAFSSSTYPESEMQVASLWTATDVFFAYRCKYSTLNLFEGKDPAKDFWTLWNRDVVEVFLNPQPERLNHYFEYEVAPNNLWIDLEIDLDKNPFNDPGWNSEFDHVEHIDAQNHVWTSEMRIPVRTLGGVMPIHAHAVWRVNFYRADGIGADSERRFLSWSPVHSARHTFHTPSSFGLIQFGK